MSRDLLVDGQIVTFLEEQYKAARDSLVTLAKLHLSVDSEQAANKFAEFAEGLYVRSYVDILQTKNKSVLGEARESRAKLFEHELRSIPKLQTDIEAIVGFFKSQFDFKEFKKLRKVLEKDYLEFKVSSAVDITEAPQVFTVQATRDALRKILQILAGKKANNESINGERETLVRHQEKLASLTLQWLETKLNVDSPFYTIYAVISILMQHFYVGKIVDSRNTRLTQIPDLESELTRYEVLARRMNSDELLILQLLNIDRSPSEPVAKPFGCRLDREDVSALLRFALSRDRSMKLFRPRAKEANVVLNIFSGVDVDSSLIMADVLPLRENALKEFFQKKLNEYLQRLSRGEIHAANLANLIHYFGEFAKQNSTYAYQANIFRAIFVVMGGHQYDGKFEEEFIKRVKAAIDLSNSLMLSDLGTSFRSRNSKIETLQNQLGESELPVEHKCVAACKPLVILLDLVLARGLQVLQSMAWYLMLVQQFMRVRMVLSEKTGHSLTEIASQGKECAETVERLLVPPNNKINSHGETNLPTLLDIVHMDFQQVVARESQEIILDIAKYESVKLGLVNRAEARCYLLELYTQAAECMWKCEGRSIPNEALTYLGKGLLAWIGDDQQSSNIDQEKGVADELDAILKRSYALYEEIISRRGVNFSLPLSLSYKGGIEQFNEVYTTRLPSRLFPVGEPQKKSAAVRHSMQLEQNLRNWRRELQETRNLTAAEMTTPQQPRPPSDFGIPREEQARWARIQRAHQRRTAARQRNTSAASSSTDDSATTTRRPGPG